MAPEHGATTGYFAVDDATLACLRSTGRDESHVALVGAQAKAAGLWPDPASEPRYTRVIEIDLARIGMHVAGPRRPQDLLAFHQTAQALAGVGFTPTRPRSRLPRHAIAIAAITSCTNTSDPGLLIAAGLLARKARAQGLTVPDWVKTSLAPGSPAAAPYLERSGLADDLAAVGFQIVGYGCTTCSNRRLDPNVRDCTRPGGRNRCKRFRNQRQEFRQSIRCRPHDDDGDGERRRKGGVHSIKSPRRIAHRISDIPRFSASAAATSYASTVTSSIDEEGAGTRRPSCRRPSRWNSIASRINCTASSRVSPTATQPGKSGTYAPYELSPLSTITT